MKRNPHNPDAGQAVEAGSKKEYQRPAYEKSYLERFVTPNQNMESQLGRGCSYCANTGLLLQQRRR